MRMRWLRREPDASRIRRYELHWRPSYGRSAFCRHHRVITINVHRGTDLAGCHEVDQRRAAYGADSHLLRLELSYKFFPFDLDNCPDHARGTFRKGNAHLAFELRMQQAIEAFGHRAWRNLILAVAESHIGLTKYRPKRKPLSGVFLGLCWIVRQEP